MAGAKPITLPSSVAKFMAKFLQKYSTPYFEKLLVAGNKTTKHLPNMGGNYAVRGTCACATFWENVETQIDRSIMHRQKNWMHNMHPMYAQLLQQVWTTFGGILQQTFRCQLQ